MQGYSPRLPLEKDESDGSFSMNKTAIDSIRQDLKMLLLTSPGEKMMDVEYGVGLKRFIFEQNIEETYAKIKNKINEQITKYMNFVSVLDIQIFAAEQNENVVYVIVTFSVPSLNVTEELNLSLKSI